MHIALEGIDGCGKSTQLTLLASNLDSQGISYEIFRYTEKRSRPLALLIEGWRCCCGHGQRRLAFHERLLQEILYSLNARYNWGRVRQKTGTIIADRSILTALAAHGCLLSPKEVSWRIIRLLEWGIPVPDAVIFIELAPELAEERVQRRGCPRNADETLAAGKAMWACYQELRHAPPLPWLKPIRWKTVEGAPPAAVVATSVAQAFCQLSQAIDPQSSKAQPLPQVSAPSLTGPPQP